MTAALAMCRACFGYRRDEAGGPCLECNARGFTGTLSLAPPVLPRHEHDCALFTDPERGECDCDERDAPSAAEEAWADSEDRAAEARRSLSW